MTSLRKRLESSDWLASAIGGALALWIRVCRRTGRWRAEGLDGLCADLAHGPVIVILWHEHLLMGPAHWPADVAPLTGIRDPSPMGRVAGAVQAAFGLGAAAMSQRHSNVVAARAVIGAARAGTSIAITADGPRGPRRVLKEPPLDWARAAGLPIYLYGWHATQGITLKSWDKMRLPLPFAGGRFRFQKWSGPLDRRAPKASRTADLDQLHVALIGLADNLENQVSAK